MGRRPADSYRCQPQAGEGAKRVVMLLVGVACRGARSPSFVFGVDQLFFPFHFSHASIDRSRRSMDGCFVKLVGGMMVVVMVINHNYRIFGDELTG